VAYLELKDKLENLFKGIAKHSADKDFPPKHLNRSSKSITEEKENRMLQ
jgi:hypothetical protein